VTEIARLLVHSVKVVYLPSHAYAGDHIHQKGHNDGGTGAELAGDSLGAEARYGARFRFSTEKPHPS
jgi:hypothetical protein